MEVIVSLTIIAVAATISIAMFGQSYTLGDDTRYRRAAQKAAQEVLTEMQLDPGAFVWPTAPNGELQAVTKADGTNHVPVPGVLATYRAANDTIENRYERLSWKAYVRVAAPDAKTCELTAVVSWIRSGTTRALTLTSIAPRRILDGKP